MKRLFLSALFIGASMHAVELLEHATCVLIQPAASAQHAEKRDTKHLISPGTPTGPNVQYMRLWEREISVLANTLAPEDLLLYISTPDAAVKEYVHLGQEPLTIPISKDTSFILRNKKHGNQDSFLEKLHAATAGKTMRKVDFDDTWDIYLVEGMEPAVLKQFADAKKTGKKLKSSDRKKKALTKRAAQWALGCIKKKRATARK